MSAAQQAGALPAEAMRFSSSFADKLTGGASSLPSTSSASAASASAEITGEGGPLVASAAISLMPGAYDPRVMHRTEPWRRALVNDEPFAVQTKVSKSCLPSSSSEQRLLFECMYVAGCN